MNKKLIICLIIITFVSTGCSMSFGENIFIQDKSISPITSDSVPINIKAPKSIGFKPFENEKYVSLEDFDFGDYFPMIRLLVPNATNHPYLYDYAILIDNSSDINDGKELYEIFISKFKLSLNKNTTNYYASIIGDYIGKRRILKISEDGEKILCATINDISKSGVNEIIYEDGHIFEIIIEIFHGQTLIHKEKIVESDGIYGCLKTLDYYDYEFTFGLQQTNLDNFYCRPSGIFIEQVLEKNLLLIVMGEDFPGDKDESEFYKDGDNINNHDVYIINTDTLGQKYLGSYMFDPMISPDLKYIIYNYPNGEGASSYFTKANKLKDMPKGFFIKNLETNEITFIPAGKEYEVYSSVGWIKREGLESLIK